MQSCLVKNVLRASQKSFSTVTRISNAKPFLAHTQAQPNLSLSFFQRLYSNDFNAADWSDETFQKITKDNKLVVFMKGTPDSPMCGFSKYVIQILDMHGCTDFKAFNVLDDEELRKRVKEFSNWPTIPQIYVDGEFLGGFDIMLQMHQNGELIEELEKIGHRSALIDKQKE